MDEIIVDARTLIVACEQRIWSVRLLVFSPERSAPERAMDSSHVQEVRGLCSIRDIDIIKLLKVTKGSSSGGYRLNGY